MFGIRSMSEMRLGVVVKLLEVEIARVAAAHPGSAHVTAAQALLADAKAATS
jgi:hypothetical protein